MPPGSREEREKRGPQKGPSAETLRENSRKKKEEAPPGFEPGIKDLQSSALATWPRRHVSGGNLKNPTRPVKGNRKAWQEKRIAAENPVNVTEQSTSSA